MATFRLFVTSGTLGTPRIQPAKAGWNPYSWPPEWTESELARILGGHTAHFPKSDGSDLF